MLTDFNGADRVYIACGYTDLRRGIDGLAVLVRQLFNLDPFTNTLFLFCGRRRDRIKALYCSRECGNEWYASVKERTVNGPGCPVCRKAKTFDT